MKYLSHNVCNSNGFFQVSAFGLQVRRTSKFERFTPMPT